MNKSVPVLLDETLNSSNLIIDDSSNKDTRNEEMFYRRYDCDFVTIFSLIVYTKSFR